MKPTSAGSILKPLLVLAIMFLAACGSDQHAKLDYCQLEATVVSPDGNPICGAEVTVMWPSSGPSGAVAVAVTTEDGRCTVDVPVDTALRLKISAENRLMPRVPLLITPAIPVADVSVILPLAEGDGEDRWRIKWCDDLGFLSQCEEFLDTTERALASWREQVVSNLRPGTNRSVVDDESMANLEKARDRIRNLAETAENPRFKSFAAVHRLWFEIQSGFSKTVSRDGAQQILEAAPIESPFWGYYPNGVIAAIGLTDPEQKKGAGSRSVFEVCLSENPDPRVRAEALAALIALSNFEGDFDGAEKMFDRLSVEFGDVYDTDILRMFFDPEGRIREGQPAPQFEVTLLDGHTLTNLDFEGKYLLIDFWATSCGPCKTELPNLHKAHREFHDRGFEILSISVDSDREKVDRFREERFPMPWRHAVIPEGYRNELARTYNVRGVPYAVLVDPDGVVIATAGKTRGEKLIETLEQHLPAKPVG